MPSSSSVRRAMRYSGVVCSKRDSPFIYQTYVRLSVEVLPLREALHVRVTAEPNGAT